MCGKFKSSLFFLCAVLAAGHAVAQNEPLIGSAELNEFSDNPKMLAAAAASYENGEGVPRDYIKAMALYCKAAKMGDVDSQFALGWMYANGRGVERDNGIARQLFVMAAAQGHQQASIMLQYTQGVPVAELPACLMPEPPALVAEEDNKPYQDGPIYKRVENLVGKLAPDFDVDPKLALAFISVESGFNTMAKSPRNAQGLMQLIPETAQRFHVKNAFNEEDNIKGGLAYLQWLLAFYKGNVRLVAAAYNAGEKAVEAHRGVPPYPETQDYVRKIASLYKKATHPYKHDLLEVSSQIP